MTLIKKQITSTIIATIIFYVVGRLAYEYFYRLTLHLVKYFSDNKISFFGKFPFWFTGDPIFGLVFCSIPLTIFLCCLILKNQLHSAFRWTLFFYLPLLAFAYLLNCYWESVYLIASNDTYKLGQTLIYSLRRVNLNELFLSSIVMATILTSIINFIKRYLLTKRVSSHVVARPTNN